MLHRNMWKQERCKPHVCPPRIPHILWHAQSLRRASVFYFPKPNTLKTLNSLNSLKHSKTLNPKLNPENLKSKSLRIASVFIHPLVTSIWYCLGVLFGCGRTWGLQLQGTCRCTFLTMISAYAWVHKKICPLDLHRNRKEKSLLVSSRRNRFCWHNICASQSSMKHTERPLMQFAPNAPQRQHQHRA